MNEHVGCCARVNAGRGFEWCSSYSDSGALPVPSLVLIAAGRESGPHTFYMEDVQ